jgi:hypothetical protein
MSSFDKIKSSFFDTKLVTNSLDKGIKKALSKFGAYVWRRAKSSLKYSKPHVSGEAGKPPKVHKWSHFQKKKMNKKTGKIVSQSASPLRELTFFGYDAPRRSVVIGPVPFKRAAVLPVIEYGGNGHFAHPWVTPAFEAELPKAAPEFKGIMGPR